MNETTATLDRPVEIFSRPLPTPQGTETRPIGAVVEFTKYALVEKNGRYRLWTTSYAEYGRAHFLDLGRAASYISKRHFALRFENNGLYIKDLGSRNGTWVNGVDIRGAGWVELKEGDVIKVANIVTFRVVRI